MYVFVHCCLYSSIWPVLAYTSSAFANLSKSLAAPSSDICHTRPLVADSPCSSRSGKSDLCYPPPHHEIQTCRKQAAAYDYRRFYVAHLLSISRIASMIAESGAIFENPCFILSRSSHIQQSNPLGSHASRICHFSAFMRAIKSSMTSTLT